MATKSYLNRSYGAFELKQSYQRNLGLSLAIAGLIHVILVFSLFIIFTKPESEKKLEVVTIVVDLLPPPSILEENIKSEIKEGTDGNFQAIAKGGDQKDLPQSGYHGKIDNAIFSDVINLDGGDENDIGYTKIISSTKYLSTKTKLTETEIELQKILPESELTNRLPVCCHVAYPVYPETAAVEDIEGAVWVEAFVDTNGIVVEAVVHTTSGYVKFDSLAVEAARKCEYKPAIFNKRRTPVRIIYAYGFKPKRGLALKKN